MTRQLSMDRAAVKLAELHAVTGWLLRHWRDFPEDLIERQKYVDVPRDPRAMILGLVEEDLTNLLVVARQWRTMAQIDGVDVELSDDDETEQPGGETTDD